MTAGGHAVPLVLIKLVLSSVRSAELVSRHRVHAGLSQPARKIARHDLLRATRPLSGILSALYDRADGAVIAARAFHDLRRHAVGVSLGDARPDGLGDIALHGLGIEVLQP